MTEPTKSVLIIAYAFPPTGGAGVQRMSKLTKYIAENGFRPRVLTVSNPSVPLIDKSLLADLPSGMEITRARTFEPGYRLKGEVWAAESSAGPTADHRLLGRLRRSAVRALGSVARQVAIPDIQVLWLPAAARALGSLLSGSDVPDVVMISGPPFSAMLLAALATRRTAIVLDYRDEWQMVRQQFEMIGGAPLRRFGDRMEAFVLRRADVVICATKPYCSTLTDRFAFLDPARVVEVTNGFDPADFDFPRPPLPTDRFVVTHAGTLYRLTNPTAFLHALALVAERRPDLARWVDVRFIGRVVESEQAEVDAAAVHGVSRVPYLAHGELLGVLAASHLTLCLVTDVAGSERIYPAKIFELMAVGRPVLTISPVGVLSELVVNHRLGPWFAPDDIEGIAGDLVQRLEQFVSARAHGRVIEDSQQAVGIERYDRRATSALFAAAFRLAIGHHRRPDLGPPGGALG